MRFPNLFLFRIQGANPHKILDYGENYTLIRIQILASLCLPGVLVILQAHYKNSGSRKRSEEETNGLFAKP